MAFFKSALTATAVLLATSAFAKNDLTVAIQLEPQRLDPGCFEVRYRFSSGTTSVAEGLTRHLAIRSDNRRRCSLPDPINRWLEASGLNRGVQPL